MLSWTYPNPQAKRHLDRFSRFSTANSRVSLYFIMCRPFPQKSPFAWKDLDLIEVVRVSLLTVNFWENAYENVFYKTILQKQNTKSCQKVRNIGRRTTENMSKRLSTLWRRIMQKVVPLPKVFGDTCIWNVYLCVILTDRSISWFYWFTAKWPLFS